MPETVLQKRDYEGFLRVSVKLLDVASELVNHFDDYVRDGEHFMRMATAGIVRREENNEPKTP